MLDQVRLHVNELFRHTNQMPHFERTLYWLLEFYAEPDEAFQIAAYAHDIERATRNEQIAQIPVLSPQGYCDPDFLKYHQEQGAEMITTFLKSRAYPLALCDRVYRLVSTHEVGGDFEQNMLKDCDSLSFFETQVGVFVTKKVPELGAKKVRDKFDWMFSCITASEVYSYA